MKNNKRVFLLIEIILGILVIGANRKDWGTAG